MMAISEQITAARNSAGMNKQEFAKKLRVSTGTARTWEAGTHCPSVETLFNISRETGYSFTVDASLSAEVKPTPAPVYGGSMPGSRDAYPFGAVWDGFTWRSLTRADVKKT